MKDTEVKVGMRVTFDCKYMKKVLHGEVQEIINGPLVDTVVVFDNGCRMAVWPQNLEIEQ